MNLIIYPMDEQAARDIVTWRYAEPYQMYGLQDESAAEEIVAYLLNPQNQIYRIDTEQGDFLAFCSFGEDACVSGGEYSEEALDVGLGLRPELTGQGFGPDVIKAVLVFAVKQFNPDRFRVTIAGFNQRAQKAWMKHGFQLTQNFERTYDQFPFVILTRQAKRQDGD